MPKFSCSCGHVVNLSSWHPDEEFALIPEKRIEKIGELLDETSSLTIDQYYSLIDEVKTVVYRCPECGRLHIEENGKTISYVKEATVENGLV